VVTNLTCLYQPVIMVGPFCEERRSRKMRVSARFKIDDYENHSAIGRMVMTNEKKASASSDVPRGCSYGSGIILLFPPVGNVGLLCRLPLPRWLVEMEWWMRIRAPESVTERSFQR